MIEECQESYNTSKNYSIIKDGCIFVMHAYGADDTFAAVVILGSSTETHEVMT